jgi:FtsP/CotA-like multicopper oxidase with cupredoxin domain
VELVLVDETRLVGGINHPFHLHGFQLYVTGLYQNKSEDMTVRRVMEMAETRGLARSTVLFPPIKDTVSIPSRGYTIVRFRADNPGFWIMHCHFEWHMAAGMGLVLQVGEPREMAKAPKGFPKCGSFMPDIYNR